MIHFKLIETSDNYDVVIKEFINLAKQIGYNIKSSSNDISNLSWFIIQFKNNKEMLFQRGASSNCWLISYSPKFGFVNGNKIIRPYATDEAKILHDNGKPIKLENGFKKWYIGISDDENCFYITALADTGSIFIASDIIDSLSEPVGLFFSTGNALKCLIYFENDVCKRKIIDNWIPSKNFEIYQKSNLKNGNVQDNKLFINGLLIPCAENEFVHAETNTNDNNDVFYKMIGKTASKDSCVWVVKGAPDFDGKFAELPDNTFIYIADTWL